MLGDEKVLRNFVAPKEHMLTELKRQLSLQGLYNCCLFLFFFFFFFFGTNIIT